MIHSHVYLHFTDLQERNAIELGWDDQPDESNERARERLQTQDIQHAYLHADALNDIDRAIKIFENAVNELQLETEEGQAKLA